MKHHDSVQQASNKLALSLEKLSDWRLPATPINYSVAYEYIAEKNPTLNQALEQKIKDDGNPDNFVIESFYVDHIVGQKNFRADIVDDIDEVLSNVEQGCNRSTKTTQGLVDIIADDISAIESGNAEEIAVATQSLKKAAFALKKQQEAFARQMLAAQRQSLALKEELAEAKKDIYFDAITGLYNRKALNKHFDAWVATDPNQHIGALVIDIDHFSEFSHKFGTLIGDVILSKIANKISRYVDDSGLPVRTGNHEFLVLLPDVEQSATGEIAEKIRQGVERLRFISSKSGIRLPQMTISLGVSEYKINETLDSLMKRTRDALKQAQQAGRNTVSVA